MVEHARAVVIGGGVGGTSVAYHLAELGWSDVVLVDRAGLTSGSTFHSAGLVGQLRSTTTLTRMMMYGADLYRRLTAETGIDVFRIFDALNDVSQMRPAIDAVRATGTSVAEVAICYTGDLSSPDERLYTLDYYLHLAEQIVDAGAHVLAIKDMAGLLRAPAARTLVTALREGGGRDEDVNDGRRTGGRLSVLFRPTADISITPRIVYQEVRANGFNRQDEFNLFANRFTTTRPAVDFRKREQFLLLDERFADDTLLADLTASIGFGGVSLTSVTSYIDRELVVGRDASALVRGEGAGELQQGERVAAGLRQ